MTQQPQLRTALQHGQLDEKLKALYGCANHELPEKRRRFASLLARYSEAFGIEEPVSLFSAPGRTELGGNHTDHQHGRVLAAAVELDAIACAGKSGSEEVRILSAGYPDVALSVRDLSPWDNEAGTSAALVRGIAAGIQALGYPVGGFHACVDSNVLGGSGLSSSAAYEVLIGTIFNHLFCGGTLSMVQLAQIGQVAENHYFGKPCGLMDQLSCAVGGVAAIDFRDPVQPAVEKLRLCPADYGYTLCIIDSGADHAGLTAEYAAIPAEMGIVAAYFGKKVLREVDEDAFWAALPALRETAGDRAVLRAIHFFSENRTAQEEADALRDGDFGRFLALVRRSGASSAQYLQNLSCTGAVQDQALAVAIAAAEHLLGGKGAVRVHGGGFAGTVQAHVPQEMAEEFRRGMESILGRGCCRFLRLRNAGGTVLI